MLCTFLCKHIHQYDTSGLNIHQYNVACNQRSQRYNYLLASDRGRI